MRYADWFGKVKEEMVGKTVAEVFGPEMFQTVKPYLERAFQGDTVVFERSHIYKDDPDLFIEATYVPDKAPDGFVKGLVVLVEDVTEHKRAEEQRRAIERQLMLLIEASGTLLASPGTADVLRNILDLAQRFVEADAYSVWRKEHGGNVWRIAAMNGLSDEYTRTLTDSAGEAQRLPTEPIVIEDVEEAPFAQERTAMYRAEGIRSLITVPLRIHAEVAGTIVFYYRVPHRFTELETRVAAALGNLAAAALGTADSYERETRLRRLAESGERNAHFLAEAGQVLSSSLDYQSTLATVADLAVPAFADWASVDILDTSGEVQRVAIKHSDPAKLELAAEYRRKFPPLETDAVRVALRTGKSMLVEDIPDELLVQRARNPEHLRFARVLGIKSVIIAPLVVNNRSFGVLSFVSAESGRRYTKADLALAEELARRAATAVENARLFTESAKAQEALRRSNAELRRANEDLNQFAYSASHDLQEPLRMLVIYSQMLERRCGSELTDQAREYVDFIVDGAKRMEMLLRDLLVYIKSINIVADDIRPVDSGEVVRKALRNLDTAVRESKAQITCGDLPPLRITEIQLLQLFQNLIGNAIKYRSDKPPQIAITAERDGEYWKLRVSDNGIGIAPEYQDQVFGLFKRLHNKTQYPGTGIGLAICQKIVQQYGGKIWIEPTRGGGSTVCFTIPADENGDRAAAR